MLTSVFFVSVYASLILLNEASTNVTTTIVTKIPTANEIALEGVKKEEALGNRTVLDVLDAFQTLLNSQVEVVKARREYYLSAMQVMQAIGKLTAKNLKLDVELYNPKVYYKETRDKWLSTSID